MTRAGLADDGQLKVKNEGRCVTADAQKVLARAAFATFLGRWPWDYVAALTFRRGHRSPYEVFRRVRACMLQMDRICYGRQWMAVQGLGLRWFAVCERSASQDLHAHALIHQPLDGLRVPFTPRALERLWWRKCGIAKVERCRNQSRAAVYFTKTFASDAQFEFSQNLDSKF